MSHESMIQIPKWSERSKPPEIADENHLAYGKALFEKSLIVQRAIFKEMASKLEGLSMDDQARYATMWAAVFRRLLIHEDHGELRKLVGADPADLESIERYVTNALHDSDSFEHSAQAA